MRTISVYFGSDATGCVSTYQSVTQDRDVLFEEIKQFMNEVMENNKDTPIVNARVIQVEDSEGFLYYHYNYGFVNQTRNLEDLWY